MEAVKTTAPVTALAKQEQGFELASLPDAERFADKIARSGLMPDTLRGKPADVLVVLVTGHELGLRPMQAIRGIHVIKGKPVLSADLMVALVKRSPECEFFRLVASSAKVATYETLRRGEPEPTRMSWTIEQASAAGLGGDNWKRHPDAMLRARCSSALARAVYPDVVGGLYEEDEGREIAGDQRRTAAVSHYQGAPAPAATARPAPTDVTDAEIETPHDPETGEVLAPEAEPTGPSEEEQIAGWRHLISLAADSAALDEIGRAMGQQLPKGHPVRKAVSADYSARQAELRRP